MKINTAIQYLVGLGAAALLAACASNPPCPAAAALPFPPPPPPRCEHHGWSHGPANGPQAGQWPPGNMPGPGEQEGSEGGQWVPSVRPGQGALPQSGMRTQPIDAGRGGHWGGPGMPPQGAPPPLPAEVLDACAGKKSGDACVAKKDGWELKGICSFPPDTDAKFACLPPQPKGQAPAAGQKLATPPAKPPSR